MPRRFTARFATSQADIRAAQTLRGLVFRGGGQDHDRFDQNCAHVLVEDRLDQRLACVFRIQTFNHGHQIERSYAAQFYGLSGLKDYRGKLLEMGRFCINPHYNHPDILRAAWGAMTRYVDDNNIKMIFGCASFQGADAGAHLAAFALLKARHLGPGKYRPKIKAPKVVCFAHAPEKPDLAAQSAMPPLLRSYLSMGGWVSDHAVVDQDLDTLHVFTGLEVAAIPARRKRLLRAMAG